MKRILTVLLAATMMLGAVAQANAVEVRVKGAFDFAFGWSNGIHAQSYPIYDSVNQNEDDFLATQRVRTQVEFIASETLRGVLQFEIGNIGWGKNSPRNNRHDGGNIGGQLNTDGVNIETKHAYIDWYVPGFYNAEVGNALRVQMGLQYLALPSETFGNPVFGADVAGIVTSYTFNKNVALTAFWARPYDVTENITTGNTFDAMDMFGVIMPFTFENFNVTPWFVYSSIGGASQYGTYFNDPTGHFEAADNLNAYIGGFASKLTLGDFAFKLDATYGYADRDRSGLETSGWMATMAIDYNNLGWGTPTLFGWYASGDDDRRVAERGRLGGLPVVGTDDGFLPTSFGFPGNYSINDGGIVSNSGIGTWGIGFQIADLSFVKDLSHVVRFAYYRGTNHIDMLDVAGLALEGAQPFLENVYLTTSDAAYEVNLDSTYNIMPGLDMVVELGYVHLDLQSRNHYSKWDDDLVRSNAWKAQMMFKYRF